MSKSISDFHVCGVTLLGWFDCKLSCGAYLDIFLSTVSDVELSARLDAGLRLERPSAIPEVVFQLPLLCWALNPAERPVCYMSRPIRMMFI